MKRASFSTVVDEGYLARGLVLYGSLAELSADFELTVLCMDDASSEALVRMRLPNVTVLPIAELEAADPELRVVKPQRSLLEYCWTVKPSLCRHVLFGSERADRLVYLDADLMFFADPAAVLDRLEDGSIAIVPHRFPRRWDRWHELSGIYNAGLVGFRRDASALEALRWWRERCLEWCFDRSEPGRFADQQYLDDFPERFDGVTVLDDPSFGAAPWNANQYPLAQDGGRPTVDGRRLVFYHYQSLVLYEGGGASLVRLLRRLGLRPSSYRHDRDVFPLVWRTDPVYEISDAEIELLWFPYLRRLEEALANVEGTSHAKKPAALALREVGGELARHWLPVSARRVVSRARAKVSRSQP